MDISLKIKAFIIGPIGDKDEPHGSPRRVIYEDSIQVLEEIISPACEELGIELLRADQITRTGEIPEQIFRHIRDSPIVIADLTGANPNVMYELGLRHTTGKLTVQIGERERLPFDVSAIRTIMFKRTESGLVSARKSLIQVLATGMQSGGDPIAATRIWFEDTSLNPLSGEDFSDGNNGYDNNDMEDLGFLEKLANTEEGMQTLVQAMGTTASIVEEISRIFVDGTEKTNKISAIQGISTAKLAIANRVAALLEQPSLRLRIASHEFTQAADRTEPGLIYLLEDIAKNPEQILEAPDFLPAIQMLISGAELSVGETLKFKEIIDTMGAATRSLKHVTKQISTSLQALADSSTRIGKLQKFINKIEKN